MAEVKQPVHHRRQSDHVVDRARDFWTRNSRPILIACGAIILLGGGWLAYKYFVKLPKEQKASDALWKAEQLYVQDSLQKAWKGAPGVTGAEKIASQYDGTAAGNLAAYYAGVAALKAGDNNAAVKHLKDFSTESKMVQARAYKLLADAYANLGKNADALNNYKKAAKENEDDQQGASQYLFYAAYFAHKVAGDQKQAIELYKELGKKYPRTEFGSEAEKYLAQLGVYKTED
jgi:predicted negative regulator of RcsB-dependent stress response